MHTWDPSWGVAWRAWALEGRGVSLLGGESKLGTHLTCRAEHLGVGVGVPGLYRELAGLWTMRAEQASAVLRASGAAALPSVESEGRGGLG